MTNANSRLFFCTCFNILKGSGVTEEKRSSFGRETFQMENVNYTLDYNKVAQGTGATIDSN